MVAMATLRACLLSTGILAGLASGIADADIQAFGPYAGDTVDQLQAWGYNVTLNGVGKDAGYLDAREKWSCQVTGIHPTVTGPLPSGQFQTVYVDMSCPPSNNSPTN